MSVFEKKIKPMFIYIGTIGATLTIIAYIALVFILIFGIEVRQSIKQTVVFALVNGLFGLIVMQFLKYQGTTFASEIEENKDLLNRYYNTKTKDKNLHSIKYFWVTSLIKDIILKALTIIMSTTCIIYIVIKGSQSWVLLIMALVNILMFICFGLLSLVKAYDFYNNMHIPYIKEKLTGVNKDVINREEFTTASIQESSRYSRLDEYSESIGD